MDYTWLSPIWYQLLSHKTKMTDLFGQGKIKIVKLVLMSDMARGKVPWQYYSNLPVFSQYFTTIRHVVGKYLTL